MGDTPNDDARERPPARPGDAGVSRHASDRKESARAGKPGAVTAPAIVPPDKEPWPYLTADVPAVPGTLKRFYEDFVVEEIPLYPPDGEGDHVLFTIEKAGLSTHNAVADIARALGVRPRDIGLAGLKDARAVTRQTLSVEHVEPERILALELPRIRVLSAARHRRKLRVGHLAGNRFTIRLRDTDPSRLDDVREVLATLERRGVPNYFGPQRFGTRGDTAEIGRRLIAGDYDGAVSLIAGSPGPGDTGTVLRARELFEAGEYREAAPLWPRAYTAQSRLSRAMAREKGDARRALHAVDRRLLRFFVNAYQSWIFNQVLARRIDTLDRVLEGDLAYKHETGGIFLVEDAAAEQRRATSFEISPTGPLPGPEMREPHGEPARLETMVLRESGLRLEDFPAAGPFRTSGSRRPLRFPLHEPTVEPGHDDAGDFLEFRFTLLPGAYATAVLREVCKDRLVEGSVDDNAGDDMNGAADAPIED